MPTIDHAQLSAGVAEILNRWPTVGLAVGVVHDGRLGFVEGRGLADIASNTPVTEDTVFRIGSVTKTMTAVAVLQLCEQGRIDLDAPARDYLRAYQLVPARSGFGPVTVRHLLTHTAGIREVLHPSGLLRMRDLGETVPAGRPVPSLAAYYRGGLRVDAEPGTRFMYSNHCFATLAQVVEDVSGEPLDRYLRERLFDPLGMTSTDLLRSTRLLPRLATGYELRSHGAEVVADYDVITAGAGGVYSTPADVARYLAALLAGGAGEHGSVLTPASVAAMVAPQYQPDPRVPGMGLAFFRTEFGGRPAVEHDGILPGFDAQVILVPGDGVAVMAFANGARRGMHWLTPEVARLLRQILDVPQTRIRTDVAQRPDIWAELCGYYRFRCHPTDPARFALGAGAEVGVRHGRLVLRFLSPIPALYRGVVLHPDDDRDPYVFRAELPWLGIGTARVVFSREAGAGTTGLHLDVAPVSFEKRPATADPRRWAAPGLGVLAVTAAVTAGRRWRRRREGGPA